MGHLPQIKPAKLIKIIQKKGFTTVPNHRKTIGKGLLSKILKDTKITVEELK